MGRIDLPWVNFTPPIRGGLFRQLGDDETTSSSDDDDLDSSRGSANSSSTSIDTIKSSLPPTPRAALRKSIYSPKGSTIDELRRPITTQVDIEPSGNGLADNPTNTRNDKPEVHHQSPTVYVTSTVQKEIDDNVHDYPSLDAITQRNITIKYQALHQRVKDEGFYDCRYREYAKEAVRYVALFSVFFIALRSGWYMTSAAFLGLFWVSYRTGIPSSI